MRRGDSHLMALLMRTRVADTLLVLLQSLGPEVEAVSMIRTQETSDERAARNGWMKEQREGSGVERRLWQAETQEERSPADRS